MRAAVALVRAKVKAVLFLPQIIAAVHIAQQRQFAACFFCARLDLWHSVKDQILMAHHHHRQITAKHFAHFARIVTRRIDHDIAGDLALWRGKNPFFAHTFCARHGAKPLDMRAQIARALGQGLGQLRRINIAVIGIIERAQQIMRFHKGINRLDFIRLQQAQIHALIAAHAHHAGKFGHALGRMGQPHGTCDIVIHRVIHRLAKAAVQLGRIALHIHNRPTG